MTDSTKYDKKERRGDFPVYEGPSDVKEFREEEFNKVFKPLLNVLRDGGHEIGIGCLFECMKCYIPCALLPAIKKDFLIKITPLIKRRLL